MNDERNRQERIEADYLGTVEHSRYESGRGEMKRRMFKKDPLCLMEAIAIHYTSLSVLALTMRNAIEFKRRAQQGMDTGPTDELIVYCRAQLSQAHQSDFGVLPSWGSL